MAQDIAQAVIAECYGGLESHLLDIMKTIELASSADASAGWCLMNYQTAALICGSILPEWARLTLAADERCVPSGVLAPTGSGQRVDGAIKVSGRWSFGSGCPNANGFLRMVVIIAEESSSAKSPFEVVMAMFSMDQFKTIDNWNVPGLRCTDSGDVVVTDEFAPEGRSWTNRYFTSC